MDKFSERMVKVAKREGATYADIRIINSEYESVRTQNATVRGISRNRGEGFGIRVIYNGSWGFSSSWLLTEEEVERITEEAIQIAKASSMAKINDVILAPIEVVVDEVPHQAKIDPFYVDFSKKIAILKDANKRALSVQGIVVSKGSLQFLKERKIFASTEGSYIVQERIESGGGTVAIASNSKDTQTRGYPTSFDGDHQQAGFEFIEGLNISENSEKRAKEAVLLLTAKPCPSGVIDIVLDGSQLALQIHESLGHPAELDRVFGTEASYAGTSFLTPDKKDNFQYGSSIVNITADATIPHALGGLAFDDEGVKAKRAHLVKDGIFKGYLNSRETALLVNEEPIGAMRADGFSKIPIIRMVSVNLEPGDKTLDELISGVDNGIYMETNRSWSIDDKRLNFQFGCEMGHEIKNGKIQDIVKNPTYTGITYEFWRSCDGIGNKDLWHVWGLPNCGKGEPPQVAHVSHGASPARFRNVRVGVINE